MSTIFKYGLKITSEVQEIEIPLHGVIQHVGEQNGSVFMWIQVDKDKVKVLRRFILQGTGHDMHRNSIYQGTVQMSNGLVWHVYEDISPVS